MDAAHQARPGVLLIRAGNTILRFALGAALASLMILALGSADGQTYPARPIRFVVPFPAGGTPDSIARMLGAMLDQHMGVPVVVDNRSGANGIIGAEIVRKAANDGYTFLLTTVSFINSGNTPSSRGWQRLRPSRARSSPRTRMSCRGNSS